MKKIASASIVSSLAILLAVLATTTNAVGYGEDCDNVTLCDAAYACRYGVCACSNIEYSFDVSQGRCIGVVGSPCESDTHCGPLMECRELFCSCVDGFSPTLESQCKKGYQAVCTTSNECNQDAQLMCPSERKCRCDDSTHVYDSATMLCRAKVGHVCDPYTDMKGFPNGQTGHRCVHGGSCQRNSDGSGHTCTCGEGFEVTEGKECKAVEGGNGDGGSGASTVSAGVAFILSAAVLATKM